MQRQTFPGIDRSRARGKSCLQARLETGTDVLYCLRARLKFHSQFCRMEAKLDPTYHAAIVAQNHREYNALLHVQQHAQEYRRGPVGYPIKVINDAIRSVRARLRLLFTHLTILYSRHFESDKLADEVTNTARNAALRSELALFFYLQLCCVRTVAMNLTLIR